MTPPPRLHVLLRPESPVALVIRQGPSRTFCTIGWKLARDRFELGQWVKHKLYPERGDISPDGKWHLYFALNGRWKSETAGAWTGLARVPYLKCLTLWPQGHTWGGGGMIVHAREAGGREPTPPLPEPFRTTGGARTQRLVRDGWTPTKPGHTKRFGRWTLDKRLAPGFLERHTLIDPDGVVHDRASWQWADVDAPRDRVVFAEAGRICSVPVRHPLRDPKVLFDANGMTFEAIAAPY
jgi:hypothetical protein